MRRAHSAAATTRDRLNHHRIAEFSRKLDRIFVGLDNAVTARRYWHAGFASARPRHVLVPHFLNYVRRRPDEFDFAAFNHFREMRVLGQETVAGMNRVDVAHLSRAHDAIDL